MTGAGIDVAIVCARKNEAHAARSIQQRAIPDSLADQWETARGMLGSLHCITMLLGIGLPQIQQSMESLIEHHHPRIILNYGAAGSLRNSLPIGIPTVPREVMIYNYHTLTIQKSIPLLGIRLPTAMEKSIHRTRAGTCDRAICDQKIRDRIAGQLNLETTDCETGYLAEICRLNDVPFIALRCITDCADGAAPADYGRIARQILDGCAHYLVPIAQEAITNFYGST